MKVDTHLFKDFDGCNVVMAAIMLCTFVLHRPGNFLKLTYYSEIKCTKFLLSYNFPDGAVLYEAIVLAAIFDMMM
jgi:hypothetical protein